jgi:hypothetical protein
MMVQEKHYDTITRVGLNLLFCLFGLLSYPNPSLPWFSQQLWLFPFLCKILGLNVVT